MANTITNVLPKLLAQGLMALRQNAVMPRLVNRSLDSLASSRGNVINVPIPSAITATNITAAAAFPTNADFSPTVAVVTLDFWKEATFQLSDNDLLSCMDGTIPMQASEAIKALGNAVDQYILTKHTGSGTASPGIFGFAGTAGTTPFSGSLTAAVSARTILSRQLAPQTDRRLVCDPVAAGNLLLNSQVLQFDQRGDGGGIIDGVIGRKLGFDFYENQNITAASYTPGTGWASGNIASTVAGVAGQTTLNIINATASGQIKVGDIFNMTGQQQQYVVTVTTTVSATVASIITFYPALVSAVATGATLVVVSITYTPNFAFHRDAFAWASRPLADINGYGDSMASAVDPVSGIALRLEVSRQYRQTTFAYDILGGGNLIRPELACKIGG